MRAHWERVHASWARARADLAAAFPLDGVPAAPGRHVLAALTDDAVAGGMQATRVASGVALRAVAEACPALVGGSADLAGSTNTAIPGGDVEPGSYAGRTVAFGVREHAMAAAMNGMSLHGGLRVFGSTFLVFADYLRPALRLAALMRQPVIHVFTHDSVHVGEDGPTHQPVEHIESLRIIPGLTVLRPADAAETALAWELALANTEGPTALVLSRQALPVLGGAGLDEVREHGARTVRTPPDGAAAEVVLAASGSEVAVALKAAELLATRDVEAQVLSVPWRESLAHALRTGRFRMPDAPVVWVEAGVRTGWSALAGPRDTVVGLDRFGVSGPGLEVAAHLGLSFVDVARAAMAAVGRGPT